VALRIAFKVKARRLELDLTQEEVAARAGVRFATYRRFEQTGGTVLLTTPAFRIMAKVVLLAFMFFVWSLFICRLS
jgi:transcriptional regulator with XRE-family HTH domain